MRAFEKTVAGAWAALAALAALDASRLWPLSRLGGLPLCLFHAATGLPCPGCGMTRALVALFEGRWSEALALNALAFPLLAAWTSWLVWGFANRARGRSFGAGWPDLLGGRRGWAALAAVLLLWAGRLHADQAEGLGCAMNPKSLRAMISEHSKEVGNAIERRREPHELIEEATLRDGVHLKVRQGGCAHYGKRFEFSGVSDLTSLGQRRYYYELAATLLSRKAGPHEAPLDSGLAKTFRDVIPSLREWLFERSDSPRAWGECTSSRCATAVRCEDAVCTVEVQREDRDHVTVVASFDFPDVPHQ